MDRFPLEIQIALGDELGLHHESTWFPRGYRPPFVVDQQDGLASRGLAHEVVWEAAGRRDLIQHHPELGASEGIDDPPVRGGEAPECGPGLGVDGFPGQADPAVPGSPPGDPRQGWKVCRRGMEDVRVSGELATETLETS